MKKIIFLLMGMVLFTQNCSSQQYVNDKNLSKMLTEKQFSFVAQRANPTNFDVINVVNTLPNAASSRIFNLDSGYSIDIKPSELEVVLPYFGRTFNASRDLDKQGLRFTSTDFSYEEKEGRKNRKIITIKPNDQKNINEIIIEVNPNGKAYASFSLNDRQSISFDGYVTELKDN